MPGRLSAPTSCDCTLTYEVLKTIMGIVPSRKCTSCGLNLHVTRFVPGDSRCDGCREARSDRSDQHSEVNSLPGENHLGLPASDVVAAVGPKARSEGIDPEMISAYMKTHYRVKLPDREITLRVGHRSAELERLLVAIGATSAAFITAANPLSRELPEAVNADRCAALARQALDIGATVIPALGSAPDRSWVEPSWLILGIAFDDATAMADEYEQNAFVWLEADQPARLILRR